MTVVVLDHGSGNLRSAERALAAAGAQVEVTADLERAATADGLVVPGVGAFAACMAGLVSIGGEQVIRDRVAAGRPVLGICVGAQILFEAGIEHGERTAGVGLLPGVVEQVRASRLPHMGWNTVSAAPDSTLFAGVAEQRFYFVHSYAVRDLAPLSGVTTVEHGGDTFLAAVEQGVLSATQFHPEKSGAAGAGLLANWVSSLRS